MKSFIAVGFIFLCLISGCAHKPNSESYQKQYRHLKDHKPKVASLEWSDYYLMIFVSARHLDYSDGKCLLKTIAKHPEDGSKNGDVGHAWIRLKGMVQGRLLFFEGGHSGELGTTQPRYFDGVMDYAEEGDLNPIKYLWEVQKDGFFQKGSGGHHPSYVIKLELTEKQFYAILSYINPKHYDYRNYSLIANQCASFVSEVAKLAGLDLKTEVVISIPQIISMGKTTICLWNDPQYSKLTLSSPDILEKSMMKAVEEGQAFYVPLPMISPP